MRGSNGRQGHAVLNAICVLLLVFLVLFPKGGIKMGFTPLTWGYLILGVTAVPATYIRLVKLPLVFRPSALLAFGLVIPFQIVCMYSVNLYPQPNLGILFSDLAGFYLFPFLFLLIYPAYLPMIDPVRFERYFRICILVAALWGIFLFAWRPIFGFYIEIPLLTVNLGDFGQLEATKHINRGAFYKLISTYNNGNVYGVATLILFPLYKLLESSRWKRNAVRVALVLTLSRTVWLGLLAEQLLSMMMKLLPMVRTLPRIYLGLAKKEIVGLVLTVGAVFVGFLFSVQSLAFLADTSLGGREAQFEVFAHPTLLPSVRFNGFAEVMYSSALLVFGLAGLIAILLIFLSPLMMALLFPKLLRFPINRAAGKGLVLYAIVAVADGATNLIPVLAFYWFAYMVFLYGMPGEQRGAVMRRLSWGADDPAPVSANERQPQAIYG